MITGIFLTNIVIIVCALFIDDVFKLNLDTTKIVPLLNAWAVLTGISIPAYIIYLIWS